MLLHLKRLAEEGIAKYPTTLEEDYEILKRDDLSFNNRNWVLMRSGEKEILNWILPFADTMIALFNLDPKELKKI